MEKIEKIKKNIGEYYTRWKKIRSEQMNRNRGNKTPEFIRTSEKMALRISHNWGILSGICTIKIWSCWMWYAWGKSFSIWTWMRSFQVIWIVRHGYSYLVFLSHLLHAYESPTRHNSVHHANYFLSDIGSIRNTDWALSNLNKM